MFRRFTVPPPDSLNAPALTVPLIVRAPEWMKVDPVVAVKPPDMSIVEDEVKLSVAALIVTPEAVIEPAP